MPASTLRIWAFIHTWSSLVCTAFLLLIGLTGLPLIFHEEIDHWIEPSPVFVQPPLDTPHLSLDSLVRQASGTYPGEVIVSLFKDDDEPQVLVWMRRRSPRSRRTPGLSISSASMRALGR